MINPSDVDVSVLPSVPLADRRLLPSEPCIYLAIDGQGVVQYIGRSVNPKSRWTYHHRYEDLSAMGEVRIAYLSMDVDLLHGVELALINWFKPALNISGQSACEYSAPRSIGEFLKARRVALGLTQDELARRLAVTSGTLRNWEGGHSRPRLDLADVRGFAVVLRCLVGELLDVAEGNLNPAPPDRPDGP